MNIGEKNTDLKRLTGRLKLRSLTEIGRLHWNQGEEVAHTSPGLVSPALCNFVGEGIIKSNGQLKKFLFLVTEAILNGGRNVTVKHNCERDPPKDHPCQVWFNLVQGFQRRRFKCDSLRRTTDAKWWQKLTWPLARWAKNTEHMLQSFYSKIFWRVWFKLEQWFLKGLKCNKGLRRAKHDMTTACRQGKVEQVYIKSKCGHSILLDTVNC
jgi:hypothetical protein